MVVRNPKNPYARCNNDRSFSWIRGSKKSKRGKGREKSLPIHIVFFYILDLIPHRAIKSIVDVTVLMVVVVEHAIRLPGLPPLRLESDSRVLHDTVIVRVKSQSVKRNCKE